MRHIFLFTALCLSLTAGAQPSPTAQKMARLGFVDIQQQDTSIHVSLMYSRPDNFTGRILYADLREAYLHPKAARALLRAQQLLRAQRPELSLKVYDAARRAYGGYPQSLFASFARVANYRGYLGRKESDRGAFYNNIYAHIDNEAALVRRGIISMQALANRQLLRKVMKQAGFTPLRSEWWHFNLVSRAEARAHYRVIP